MKWVGIMEGKGLGRRINSRWYYSNRAFNLYHF